MGQVRDAVRPLPSVGGGSDSWTSKGAAAREHAEQMAKAMEQGNVADAVQSGRSALGALDEAARVTGGDRRLSRMNRGRGVRLDAGYDRVGPTTIRLTPRPLGPWTFPAPGMIGERHLYFVVDVDPATRAHPSEDGSALERAAAVVALPVGEALEHCRRGDIRDAKTEVALRRLAEMAP